MARSGRRSAAPRCPCTRPRRSDGRACSRRCAPTTPLRTLAAIHRRGAIGGAPVGAALRHGDRTALVDERGALSFAELHERSNALANQLLGLGLRPGDGVAILCRNHRGFVDATFACAKAGLRAIYLNTGFAGPQIADVCEREGARLLIYDGEFAELVAGAAAGRDSILAWVDEGDAAGEPTLDGLIAAGDPSDPPAPPEPATMVMLTSGTTGTPKGAPRQPTGSSGAVVALLSKVPFRVRETTVVAAPMFHSLGFAHLALALALGSTVVTRRRFDPARDPRRRRRAPGHGADRRPGDAAADPRPRPRGDRAPRHLQPADHLLRRLAAPGGGGERGDGHLRRGRLQPLRLDRGRLGDDRHASGPAGGPRLLRAPTARHRRPPLRRAWQRRSPSPARAAGSSSPTASSSTATPTARPRRCSTG